MRLQPSAIRRVTLWPTSDEHNEDEDHHVMTMLMMLLMDRMELMMKFMSFLLVF